MRLGLTRSEAEDVAQDTLVLVLEREPHNAHRYAVVVGSRLAVDVLHARAQVVVLDEVGRDPDQEAYVVAAQLAFVVRARSRARTSLSGLVDGEGSGGRMARLRARLAVTAALREAPPCFGEGAGSTSGVPSRRSAYREVKK
jgi:DNA-directed RNA polymerase specialized sigma24 family protein